MNHPFTYVLTAAIFLWGLWLLCFRLLQYRSMAGAIRYAVPTSGALWFCVEMTSLWDWYIEFWVKPFEFPVGNLLLATIFIALGTLANLTTERGAPAGS